jgi:putative acetyltransferase
MQFEGLTIRLAESDDCAALYDIFTGPKSYAGTLQLPCPSREQWRRRLAKPAEGTCYLNRSGFRV